MGIFVPFANSIGAFTGTVASLAFMLWLFIGYNVYGIKYPKKPFSIEGCSTTNLTEHLTTAANWLAMSEPNKNPIKDM